jgi:hypothetical protein
MPPFILAGLAFLRRIPPAAWAVIGAALLLLAVNNAAYDRGKMAERARWEKRQAAAQEQAARDAKLWLDAVIAAGERLGRTTERVKIIRERQGRRYDDFVRTPAGGAVCLDPERVSSVDRDWREAATAGAPGRDGSPMPDAVGVGPQD